MLLLASLVLAATASVPSLAPENLSPAMEPAPVYSIAGPVSSAAVDGDGFVLAFTAEADRFPPRARVFVTRLDRFGRMTGELRQMPVASNDGADAVLPSIVTAPDGWYVAQMELSPTGPGTLWHVNRNLPAPSAPMSWLSGVPMFVRGADGKLVVSTFDKLYAYSLDGALLDVIPNNSPDDVVVIGGKPVPVAHLARAYTPCYLTPCPGEGESYAIIIGTRSIAASLPFLSNHGIGAATDGAAVLTVFYNGYPKDGGEVKFVRFNAQGQTLDAARTLGTFPGDPAAQPLRPAVAYDGVRYVAVWQSGHSIAAASIENDGTVTPIALPHAGDGSLPNIVAAGRGRFLLSYGAVRGGAWHLATRMLYFDLGRRPAAGR